MSNNPNRKLWVAFVVVHLALTLTVGGGPFVSLRVMGLGGLVMLAGLYVQRGRLVTGSWIVVVGLIPTLISATGILVLIFGLWTATLAFTDKTTEAGSEILWSRRSHIFEQKWWHWIVASLTLFAVGFGALVVLGDGETVTGEDDTGLLNSLAWLTWMLSWLAAIVSAGLGIARGIGRHRTRSA